MNCESRERWSHRHSIGWPTDRLRRGLHVLPRDSTVHLLLLHLPVRLLRRVHREEARAGAERAADDPAARGAAVPRRLPAPRSSDRHSRRHSRRRHPLIWTDTHQGARMRTKKVFTNPSHDPHPHNPRSTRERVVSLGFTQYPRPSPSFGRLAEARRNIPHWYLEIRGTAASLVAAVPLPGWRGCRPTGHGGPASTPLAMHQGGLFSRGST